MNDKSIRGQLMHGSALMIGMRWILRLIGLMSTVVLARLLTPEDFGIVAIAALVVTLLDVFSNLGVDIAVLRHPDPRKVHYDAAWTLQLTFSLLTGVVMVISSGWIADLFSDRRLESVIAILALAPVFSGLRNIYVLDYRRNFDFVADFRVNVIPKLFSVPATIVLALILRSYWAMVLGIVLLSVMDTIFTYWIMPKRPRPSLRVVGEVWAFSGWVMLRSVATTVNQRVDQAFIARASGAGSLGGYYLAAELANVLVADVVQPINRALLPGYVRLREASEGLGTAFAKVLGGAALLAVLFGMSLSIMAPSVVSVVLGPQWKDTAILLRLLALDAAVNGLGVMFGPLLVTMGGIKLLALLRWAQVLGYVILLALLATHIDLNGFALTKLLTSFAVLPVLLAMGSRALGVGQRVLWLELLRPAVAGAVMAGVFFWLSPVDQWNYLLPSVAAFAVSVAAFFGTQFMVWGLMGRPDGIEAEAIRRLGGYLLRLPRR
jgi:lipopolysaccharide exporter